MNVLKMSSPQAKQDVVEFVSSPGLEKCSITSLAHHIIVMFLSAVWTLILTAPIH